MKKLFRIATYMLTIAVLVGGMAFFARNEKLRKVAVSFNAERDAYRSHHQPTPNWYYSVVSVTTEGDKTFIIGRNMQSVVETTAKGVVTISLRENGKLREIEVPSKKVGLETGGPKFFTVKTVEGVPTLIYFVTEQSVIQSMIQAREIPART